jgi:hypothetical protein
MAFRGTPTNPEYMHHALILQQRLDKNLKNMKPLVDTSPPRTKLPLLNNREKILREMKIEKENKLMLDRISSIMGRKRYSSPQAIPFINPRNSALTERKIAYENELIADRIIHAKPMIVTKKEADVFYKHSEEKRKFMQEYDDKQQPKRPWKAGYESPLKPRPPVEKKKMTKQAKKYYSEKLLKPFKYFV